MIKRFFGKKRSVFYSWIVSYLCVLLIPIIIGIYLYNSAYGVIKNTTEKVYEAALRQTALELDNKITEGNAVLGQLLGDEDVQRLSSVKDKMTPESQIWLITLMNRLQKLVVNHPDIEDIYVLLGESDSVAGTKGHMSGDIFAKLYLRGAMKEAGYKAFMDKLMNTKEIISVVGNDGRQKLLLHKKTLDTGLGHDSAVIVVQIDADKLMGRLSESEDMSFAVFDKEGNVVASTKKRADSGDGKVKYELMTRDSAVTSWNYVYMISNKSYEASAGSIRLKTVLGLLFCMVFGFFISVVLSKKNYNPINNLLKITDQKLTDGNEHGNEYDLLTDIVGRLYESSKVLNNIQAFSLLSAQKEQSGTDANKKLCIEIKEFIDENYKDPDLNISQAALHFDLSPSYMSGIFKKETGISLLAYISKVRTDAAKKLLESEMTIAEVAEGSGFRDSAALIRTFKKNEGVTPGQFRELSAERDCEKIL